LVSILGLVDKGLRQGGVGGGAGIYNYVSILGLVDKGLRLRRAIIFHSLNFGFQSLV